MRRLASTYEICIFHQKIVLLLLAVLVGVVLNSDNEEFQRNLPARVKWAVSGKDVELPCDVTPPVPSDNVKMILWFKDNLGTPLYSLDARGGPLGAASHLAMSDDLGSRSYFITDDQHPSDARLRIQKVTARDEGVFRCRVDFNNSPTRNFQVNLTLVVQPSVPRIFDAEGVEIKHNNSAGPFLEDDELFLSCQVAGGRPRPILTWWYNNTILDSVVDSGRDSFTTVNQLVIAHVPRSFKKSHVECRASTADIAGDVVRTIPIVVYLKPNKVKIVTPNNLLSTHQSYSIKCESSGSYPPAKLTWQLDGKAIRNALVTEEETDKFSGSILSLNVGAEDDGKDLVCRADNPRFPGGSAEDRRQIHVAYPPKVAVKLGPGVGLPVKEGGDVTFICNSSARPTPSSYSWYHEGHLIGYNESGGVLPIDDVLTLKSVTKKSEGQYACSAINAEGETYSPLIELAIEYAPRCKPGYEVMRIGMVPFETLVAQCMVDSIPDVLRFSWTYNTSKGVLPVQSATIHNGGDGVSILHFVPPTEDLQSLACWATNEVGRQATPCIFHVIPAEPPESPTNCMLRNATNATHALEVTCTAGRDGGLHQSFVLEVSALPRPPPPAATTLSDEGEPAPLRRAFGDRPTFVVRRLPPGADYQLVVYAENARGRSEPPVVLPLVRIPTPVDVAAPPSGADPAPASGARLAAILVALTAAAVLLIVGIVVAAGVIACRRRPAVVRRQRRCSKPPEELELSEAGFGEGFHRRSAQYRASMYALHETEERISRIVEGPDLILAPVSFSPQSTEY